MTKAMFGIATALALVLSSAWAGDEKSDGKTASKTVAARQGDIESKSENVKVSDSATGGDVEASRASGAMRESDEVRTSHEERWLREREGYRDGGY